MIGDMWQKCSAHAQIYLAVILVYPWLLAACIVRWLAQCVLPAAKPKSVVGEVALVTGGAGGLGSRFCIELAQRGCHIAVVDVNLNDAEKLAQSLEHNYKVKARAYQVDITQPAAVAALQASVSKDLGHTTILINNAGILLFKNIVEPQRHEVQRMIDVNLTSHFLINDTFLPQMKLQKRGHIVAVSSVAGLLPVVHYPVYTAAKFGVRGLMRSLRLTLKMQKYEDIHTTLVCPYFVKTNTQLIDVIRQLSLDSMYPSYTDVEAGRRIVAGILRNEEEIVLPDIFGLFYRIIDILPIVLQDFVVSYISRDSHKKFQEFHAKNAAQINATERR